MQIPKTRYFLKTTENCARKKNADISIYILVLLDTIKNTATLKLAVQMPNTNLSQTDRASTATLKLAVQMPKNHVNEVIGLLYQQRMCLVHSTDEMTARNWLR